jgi:hypothetical protein
MTRLGPEHGTLTVHTGRAGAIARAGHDLELEVTRWEATFTPDAIELTADPGSLRVRSGKGGMTPLGDEEKAGIAQTIREEVLKSGSISFRSTRVTPRADGLDVEGELELLGVRGALAFPLRLEDGHLTGRATVKQSAWRITPYSALFGTLKVADDVGVAIDATLPKETDDG